MIIEEGKPAPEFTLPDHNGNEVSLKGLKGKWVVLYFYPRDDTPGCTTEACEFTEGIKAFEKLDAVIYGISPDTPEKHRKFIEKYNLKVNLLSDPEHTILDKYGAWGIKKMYGRESEGVIRSTVIINPEGKIARHWPQVKAKGHAGEVKAFLETSSI